MQIRKVLTSLAACLMLTTGAGLAAVAPAQATTYIYPIYHHQVCQRQGHFGASFYNYWNPGSWYCYDLSVPFGVTFAGGLNLNDWCAAKYRGSRAELSSNNVWGWNCVKRT